MKRLISTLNLSKEDWLRYRKCGITGTDAGAILGVNSSFCFSGLLRQNSETIENIDNEAMRQGRDLEDYVAQRFTEATGLKVRRANAIYQSEEHPLLLADFDRLIVGQKQDWNARPSRPSPQISGQMAKSLHITWLRSITIWLSAVLTAGTLLLLFSEKSW